MPAGKIPILSDPVDLGMLRDHQGCLETRDELFANESETARVTEVLPMNSGTPLRVCGKRKPTNPVTTIQEVHFLRDGSVVNHWFRNNGDGSGCCFKANAIVVRDPCFATADANVLPATFASIETRMFLESETDPWTDPPFLVEQFETVLFLVRFKRLQPLRICWSWSVAFTVSFLLAVARYLAATPTFATPSS